jgi:bifunctional UDP-N-acetylglucosamine pyrophosphorylase / glucosamine-1-phosphate N-acetyltransferase
MCVPRPKAHGLAEKKTSRTLTAVILAAGKGKRLKSSTPKVLHPICGKPALWHVLNAARAARPTKIVVVIGHGGDAVRDVVKSWGITPAPIFVEQTEQLGTGHAVLAAEKAVGRSTDVLVLGGDYDPVTGDHIRELMATHRRTKGAATILTTEVADPGGYGRILRDGNRLERIVEHADATAAQRSIHEVWLLVSAFRREDLYRTLPAVGRENRQREYYLNEVFPILLEKGERVSVVQVDTGGAMGLNSRGGLAAVERVVRARINATHLANGVTLIDPEATYIDMDVKIGADTVIRPNTYLEGKTKIGTACDIGPSTRIVDSAVGDRATVTFAVVLGSKLGKDTSVGPYARLRPGCEFASGARAGAFVDLKAVKIGRNSKVPHLAYVGNAVLGADVNIGAGTVTVNYDGYEKHITTSKDGARVGSDTMLVAPVTVGKDANTGAGSVITKDVPAGSLAVERGEQRNIRGYRRKKDAEHRRTRQGE